MKSLAILLSLTISGHFGFQPKNASSSTWAEVHSFIDSHATYEVPGTEEALFTEHVIGTQTWEVFGSNARASRDGNGVGWPSTGQVILFSSQPEAEELADLIRSL